ncbi:hypothetical protein CHU98_g12094 [Xylaria longipes]|nr:hypothetical protein CHU98_g12094 [Xylaria longipes]
MILRTRKDVWWVYKMWSLGTSIRHDIPTLSLVPTSSPDQDRNMATTQLSKDLLRTQFVGKTLHQVPTPAVVLDLGKVEANCNLMLEAAKRLHLNWRAHIKTHKTAELTRLQVGNDDSTPVNIVVSTLMEAESVMPLLKEYQLRGRPVNMLYSFPVYPSSIDRLAAISAQLGPGAVTVMVDHVEQVKLLTLLASKAGTPPLVFLKVNMGGNRAGVPPDTPACAALVREILLGETDMSKSPKGRALLSSGRVRFRVGDGRKGWVEPETLASSSGAGNTAKENTTPSEEKVGGAADEDDSQGWDAIHVGAAAAELHGELVAQLRRPGRMFIPVEDEERHWEQYIWVVDKDEQGSVEKKRLFGVRYVPLTDAPRT